MVNPNCPVHNNNSSQEANNDDMFEDDDDEYDEDFFQQRLHPLQMIFIGIIDKIVNLTSHTYFAKLLQTSELYWDTTAGINQMDANCRIVFPVAFALVNAIYWPTYMYLL